MKLCSIISTNLKFSTANRNELSSSLNNFCSLLYIYFYHVLSNIKREFNITVTHKRRHTKYLYSFFLNIKGGNLIMDMRICVINIYVSDLDFAIEWYREVLNLNISDENNNYPIAVDLETDNDLRLLLHKAEKDTQVDVWRESSTILTFEVPNIREKIKDLTEKGVKLMNEEPQWHPDGGERIAFKDPFGNVHELAELRSRAAPKDRI
ncbi:hypothetical protein GLW08_18585 [Pontibacillus yanchengensis]|uniref:Uncharacterized protein n=1 Tax=Pontibacillus yanchengensis TaxID=462910 RepID=A0ACC7VKM1_9BACI|nr:hypothetical protein [Pontibacillus yanchengensis]